MSPRSARAYRVAVEETDFETVTAQEGPRPVLTFDFSGRRAAASKGPVTPEEGSTIKEAIVRWLEEQL